MDSVPANEDEGDGGPMRGDTPRMRKKVVKQMRFLESKLSGTGRGWVGGMGRTTSFDID